MWDHWTPKHLTSWKSIRSLQIRLFKHTKSNAPSSTDISTQRMMERGFDAVCVCVCVCVCLRSGREQGNRTPLQTALKHSLRDTLSAPVSSHLCGCVHWGELCKLLQDPQQWRRGGHTHPSTRVLREKSERERETVVTSHCWLSGKNRETYKFWLKCFLFCA